MRTIQLKGGLSRLGAVGHPINHHVAGQRTPEHLDKGWAPARTPTPSPTTKKSFAAQQNSREAASYRRDPAVDVGSLDR